MAPVPVIPDSSITLMPYHYCSRMEEPRALPSGKTLSAGIELQSPLLFVQPGYAPATKILGDWAGRHGSIR